MTISRSGSDARGTAGIGRLPWVADSGHAARLGVHRAPASASFGQRAGPIPVPRSCRRS